MRFCQVQHMFQIEHILFQGLKLGDEVVFEPARVTNFLVSGPMIIVDCTLIGMEQKVDEVFKGCQTVIAFSFLSAVVSPHVSVLLADAFGNVAVEFRETDCIRSQL